MLQLTVLGLYVMISNTTGLPNIPVSQIPFAHPEMQVVQTKIEDDSKSQDRSTIERKVREQFNDLPILAEIARCESTFRQHDKEGNVLRGKVNRYDVGVMQINEKYHLDASKRLGHDIYSLEGNMAYARYLYEKEGARPWMSSSPCWSHNKELAMK